MNTFFKTRRAVWHCLNRPYFWWEGDPPPNFPNLSDAERQTLAARCSVAVAEGQKSVRIPGTVFLLELQGEIRQENEVYGNEADKIRKMAR